MPSARATPFRIRAVACVALAHLSVCVAATASAQGRGDCWSPIRPSVGVALGRSLPEFELASGVATASPATVIAQSGVQIAGRADVPLIGPLRARLEGGTTKWDLRQTRYDADAGFRVISQQVIDHTTARHLVAMVGTRVGRAPACAHVSVGGGLYALGFRGSSFRRTGFTVAAGVEFPAGQRGVIQLDGTLHLIGTRDIPPISSTAAAALSLLAGWAYRF